MRSRSLPLFSGLLFVGLVVMLSSQAAPPALAVLAREGRRTIPLTIVNDQELVALDDLASAFQLAVQESLGAITVSYKGKTIVLTPDQSLASVSGRLISLPAPPVRSGRRWLVPVEFISRALAPIYDTRLDLRKPSRLLVVGDLRVPRVAVRYDVLGASARLTIDATPRADSTVSQDNQRILIRFDADAIDVTGALPAPGPQALVQAVRQIDATTLAADVGPRFAGFKATAQPSDQTMRQVIDLLLPTDTTQQPSQPAAPGQPAAPAAPPELAPSLGAPAPALRTIAIDPGHGGDDDGARSASGTKEKDITLTVARRAKAAIEARLGIRVLLTRDDDRRVALDDRTALANNNKADLFVSLHVNASLRRTTSGATIFLAAFDADAAASNPPAPERVPTFGGGLRDIELVPWDLAQTRHLDQSAAFATMLQQQLSDRVPLSAQPVTRAPMRILESANMPAVVVELGYVTNADQEKLLTSDTFQNGFVQALYDAVVRYRDSLSAGGTQ